MALQFRRRKLRSAVFQYLQAECPAAADVFREDATNRGVGDDLFDPDDDLLDWAVFVERNGWIIQQVERSDAFAT